MHVSSGHVQVPGTEPCPRWTSNPPIHPVFRGTDGLFRHVKVPGTGTCLKGAS